MDCQRWVAVAVALGALTSASAAPVPKTKPREGTILATSAYPDVPPRLFRADGTAIGQLPFKSVDECALSPDGTRAAVIARTDEIDKKLLHVVRVGSDESGSPLLVAGKCASVAWGGSEKLYVSSLHDPPGGRGGYLRPERVTVCDLARGTATEDKALHGYCIRELSPDGKHLLAQRYVSEPTEQWETVLLDAATGKRVDVHIGELGFARFFGNAALLGSRTKKGAKFAEYVVFDLTTKRAVPLKLPKEVTPENVSRVLPSPDGTRLLCVWSEEVPPLPDRPATAGRLHADRMTICDRDGGNARTIFKPEIKTREDETRNHFGGTIDWR